MDQELNQAKADIIQLKAKVYDAQEETRGYVEVLSAIAKRVNFKGNGLNELIAAVPIPEAEEPEVG